MLGATTVVGGGMTTVGFIGSGNIGGTVARLSVRAGYDVVLSNSRGPETLSDLVDELGPQARAATPAEAAAAGDIIVVSVPLKAYTAVPADEVAGKPVIDTNNYYPQRDGHIAALDDGTATSSALLQRHVPKGHVVKVFNNIYFKHLASLARPSGAGDRSALPIAGDDAAAKAAVTAFLDAIGYDAVDAGALVEGRRYEPDHPAYGAPYGPFSNDEGSTAPAAKVRDALDAA
jgi:predicted dinucleotide-binding enzyme